MRAAVTTEDRDHFLRLDVARHHAIDTPDEDVTSLAELGTRKHRDCDHGFIVVIEIGVSNQKTCIKLAGATLLDRQNFLQNLFTGICLRELKLRLM